MADYKKNGVLISYQKICTPYIIFMNEKNWKNSQPIFALRVRVMAKPEPHLII